MGLELNNLARPTSHAKRTRTAFRFLQPPDAFSDQVRNNSNDQAGNDSEPEYPMTLRPRLALCVQFNKRENPSGIGEEDTKDMK